MKGKVDLTYNPHDKSARTMNTQSNWEIGLICLADVPEICFPEPSKTAIPDPQKTPLTETQILCLQTRRI